MSIIRYSFLFLALFVIVDTDALAQNNQLNTSQQFRQASRIIRIAESGEIADSVNVWS